MHCWGPGPTLQAEDLGAVRSFTWTSKGTRIWGAHTAPASTLLRRARGQVRVCSLGL